MAGTLKSVAVITSSPALGSIITTTLRHAQTLRAQQFSRASALISHMQILPIEMIVCDFDLENSTAANLVTQLRQQVSHRPFEMIVLSDRIDREVKLACKFAGVCEVIIKPMSPLFILERILCHLNIGMTLTDAETDTQSQPTFGSGENPQFHSNVVPLFAHSGAINSVYDDGFGPR